MSEQAYKISIKRIQSVSKIDDNHDYPFGVERRTVDERTDGFTIEFPTNMPEEIRKELKTILELSFKELHEEVKK